jgi:hypothetical protein
MATSVSRFSPTPRSLLLATQCTSSEAGLALGAIGIADPVPKENSTLTVNRKGGLNPQVVRYDYNPIPINRAVFKGLIDKYPDEMCDALDAICQKNGGMFPEEEIANAVEKHLKPLGGTVAYKGKGVWVGGSTEREPVLVITRPEKNGV